VWRCLRVDEPCGNPNAKSPRAKRSPPRSRGPWVAVPASSADATASGSPCYLRVEGSSLLHKEANGRGQRVLDFGSTPTFPAAKTWPLLRRPWESRPRSTSTTALCACAPTPALNQQTVLSRATLCHPWRTPVTSLLSAHSQDVLQAGTGDAVLQAVALHLLSARVRSEAAGEAPAELERELERRARRCADGADGTARTRFSDSGGAAAGGDGMPSVRLEEQGAAPSQAAAERRGGFYAIRGLPADACGDGQSAAEAAENSRVAAGSARKLTDQGWGRL
jgi:hypothetical protein